MFSLSSYKNRVVVEDLRVTYSTEKVRYEETNYWWKVTRRATKTYKYADLTEDATYLVARSLVAKYTRPYYQLMRRGESESAPQSVGVRSLPTNISRVRASGNVWEVVVAIDEKDVRASATEPEDPATLFAVENARDYDTAEGADEDGTISSAEVMGGTAAVTMSGMSAEERSAAILQVRRPNGGARLMLAAAPASPDDGWTQLDAVPTATGSGISFEVTGGMIAAGDQVRIVSGARATQPVTAIVKVQIVIIEETSVFTPDGIAVTTIKFTADGFSGRYGKFYIYRNGIQLSWYQQPLNPSGGVFRISNNLEPGYDFSGLQYEIVLDDKWHSGIRSYPVPTT